jgi:hypothetical protein
MSSIPDGHLSGVVQSGRNGWKVGVSGKSCVDGSRIASGDLRVWRIGRVQSCVRPIDAVEHMTAGPDGIREPGPFLLCRHSASDFPRGVPTPGLTGTPSLLIVLATW